MSNRFAVIVVIAALASATTISVTGQQTPLPRVTPRGAAPAPQPAAEVPSTPQSSFWSGEMLVTLPSDPITPAQPATLADAARNNDYATFHALYVQARDRGENVTAYATLHEIWTYAVTEPLGGFYTADMRNRIARAYPSFPAYIETFKIVDSRGNVFYPTAETRSFLFAEALRGSTPAASVSATTTGSSAPRARTTSPASTTARRSTARRSQAAAPKRTQPSPAAPPKTTAPAVSAPAITAPSLNAAPASTAAPSQQPIAPAAEANVQTAAETTAPATAATDTSAAVTTPATEATPVQAAPESTAAATPVTAPTQPSATGRGLLLLVIGLVGIGILALMLRTPREEMPRGIIDHNAPPAPKPGEKPSATVEPIRKRPAKTPDQPRRNHA